MKIKHIYSILVRHCSAKIFWAVTFFLKKTYHVLKQCYRYAFIVLTRTAKKTNLQRSVLLYLFIHYTLFVGVGESWDCT